MSTNGNGHFSPEFTIKTEGHSHAHFTGGRDGDSLKSLHEFIRREKWRGQLTISYAGNGGVTDVIFHEVRRATIDKS